ncbi:hypothetical protein GCM10010493_58970 [Streptomyces lavendulae subsp. grasserius]
MASTPSRSERSSAGSVEGQQGDGLRRPVPRYGLLRLLDGMPTAPDRQVNVAPHPEPRLSGGVAQQADRLDGAFDPLDLVSGAHGQQEFERVAAIGGPLTRSPISAPGTNSCRAGTRTTCSESRRASTVSSSPTSVMTSARRMAFRSITALRAPFSQRRWRVRAP